MTLRRGHSLVEALVALTLVAVAALGAAASVTSALRWHRVAVATTQRGDDLRLTLAALQAAGCTGDSVPAPVTMHAVSVTQDRTTVLWRSTLQSGTAVVTDTRYCP
jgi:type II secretory pathway component PulJ